LARRDECGRVAKVIVQFTFRGSFGPVSIVLFPLALHPHEVLPELLQSKYTPHLGDKAGQLARKLGVFAGGLSKIHQFLSHQVIEGRLEAESLLDGQRRHALPCPYGSSLANGHRHESVIPTHVPDAEPRRSAGRSLSAAQPTRMRCGAGKLRYVKRRFKPPRGSTAPFIGRLAKDSEGRRWISLGAPTSRL